MGQISAFTFAGIIVACLLSSAGADKDAAAYYVRAMEKSQEKGDWFKHLACQFFVLEFFFLWQT